MIFDLYNESDVRILKSAFPGRVGLTSGSFDLFHDLHLVYLHRCRRLCDSLIVGVDSNDLVSARKGPDRPLISEHKRVFIVSALSCVSAAFIMGSVDSFGFAVEKLGVSFIFKNEVFEKEHVIGSSSAEVIFIPDVKQHSSTSEIIKEIVKNGSRSNDKDEG